MSTVLARLGQYLHTMRSRAAFLAAPTHCIVFHHTSTHASWMNQISI